MRMTGLILAAGLGLGACDSPPPKPQDSNVVNATLSDQAYPSSAGGNDIVTGSQPSGGAAAGPTNSAQSEGSGEETPAQ